MIIWYEFGFFAQLSTSRSVDAACGSRMEETAVWNALAPEEQSLVWKEAETKFWGQFQREQDAIRTALDDCYQTATGDIKIEISILSGKRIQLSEERDRLKSQLAEVEGSLAHNIQAYDDKVARLTILGREHRKRELESTQKRDQVTRAMHAFFSKKRCTDLNMEPYSHPQRLPPDQEGVDAMAPSWLERILNPDDAERGKEQGGKAEEAHRPERSLQGAFSRTPRQSSGSVSEPSYTDHVAMEKPKAQSLPQQYLAPRESVQMQISQGARQLVSAAAGSRFKPINGPTTASNVDSTRGSSFESGFTPTNAPSSRSLSCDTLTLAATSVNISCQPAPPAFTEPVEDITSAKLALKHNGSVYTCPEIVKGVPLAKIDQDHPYWEPSWNSLKPQVEAQLAIWRKKNMAALKSRGRGEGRSAKLQTGRQVNRGIKILHFLEHGDINPYQLVSKKFMDKGSITSYDTLFRMCETLSELAKFSLDVEPLEWLRHRLHEILMETGSSFNVAKVIHNFYHDRKLTALRIRNGFRSIGRPSGGRPHEPFHGSTKRKRMSSRTATACESSSRNSLPFPVELPQFSPAPPGKRPFQPRHRHHKQTKTAL